MVDTETLKEIRLFCDGMTEKEVPMAKISMPKWMLQGFFYGLFLGILGYFAGGVAVTAAPGLFPATSNIVAGALGFLASLGIAYTKDIVED